MQEPVDISDFFFPGLIKTADAFLGVIEEIDSEIREVIHGSIEVSTAAPLKFLQRNFRETISVLGFLLSESTLVKHRCDDSPFLGTRV